MAGATFVRRADLLIPASWSGSDSWRLRRGEAHLSCLTSQQSRPTRPITHAAKNSLGRSDSYESGERQGTWKFIVEGIIQGSSIKGLSGYLYHSSSRSKPEIQRSLEVSIRRLFDRIFRVNAAWPHLGSRDFTTSHHIQYYLSGLQVSCS